MGIKVACEQLQNDEFFAYICSLDEEDVADEQYLYDESVWPKANPSLEYGIPGYDYIRGQVKEAEGLPSKLSTVKRLCFCVWTDAENPWITGEIWNACKDADYDRDLLKNRRCWGGLDLSATQDLTSNNYLFEPIPDDPYYRLITFFWIPAQGLRRKVETDHVPLQYKKNNQQ